MNAKSSELRARYKVAKTALDLIQKAVRASKRVGIREGSFFSTPVGDLQRTYDEAAAKLEAWRKENKVVKNAVRPRAAGSSRKQKRGARGVITLRKSNVAR
jgi:hypothetical protein